MTTTNAASAQSKSKLDKAVFTSIAAMTIFVLSQQLQPVPALAAAQGSVAAQQV